MFFARSSALILGLLVGFAAHARVGARNCVEILKNINNRDEVVPVAVLDFAPGFGFGEDGAKTGTAMRKEFARLLNEVTLAGGTNEDAVRIFLNPPEKRPSSWRTYLREARHLGTFGLYGSPRRAKAPTSVKYNEMHNIQRVVNRSNVTDAIIDAANKNKKGIKDDSELKLVQLFHSLREGGTFGEDQLKIAETLHSKLLELQSRAKVLQDNQSIEGHADSLAWDYLKSNDSYFRQLITGTKEDENFYIAYPTAKFPENVVSIEVKTVRNLDDYEALYKLLKGKGEVAKKFEAKVEAYAWDYIKYRHLANDFQALKVEDITFSHNKSSKTDEEVAAEEANIKAFKALQQNIPKALASSLEIHPSPKLLSDVARVQAVNRIASKVKRGYYAAIAASMAVFILKNQIVFWDSGLNLWVSWDDRKHATDANYWIDKCSKEEDPQKVAECLRLFTSLSNQKVNALVREKRSIDPNYSDEAQSEALANLQSIVLTQTTQQVGFLTKANARSEQLLTTVPTDMAKNQELAVKARKESESHGKSKLDAIGSLVAGKVPSDLKDPDDNDKGDWSNDSIEKSVDYLSGEFYRKQSTAQYDYKNSKDDPDTLKKYVSEYLIYLASVMAKLDRYNQMNPSPKVKLKMEELVSQIGAETDKALGQVGGEALTPKKATSPAPKAVDEAAVPKAKPSTLPTGWISPFVDFFKQ